MALNPTDQDKTGIVLANYDGTADAENYPLGDKPEPITITGTGFGSRSPLYDLYKNYNTEDNGTTATSLGYLGAGSDNVTVVDTDSHEGAGKCLEMLYPATGNHFPKVRWELSSSSDRIYAAFWFKWTAPVGAGDAGILKIFRSGSFPAYTGTPKIYETIRSTSDGLHTGEDIGYNLDDGTIKNAGIIQLTKDANEWHFLEYYYVLGDAGVANGYLAGWVDGAKEFESADVVTRQDAASKIEYFINMFDGRDRDAFDMYIRQSEEYASDTPARVIVTDSATFSSSTKWQLQTVSSWSDTEIKLNKKVGSFSSGDTVYAHVFDNNNVLVSSHEVTL